MKTRSQEWSRMAYERVSRSAKSQTVAKYKTSCNKMPGLIHQSGVLQALVFQVARDEAGETYVDHLSQTFFLDPKKTHQDLIVHAQSLELGLYMAMTRDLSDIAQWFRRFAQIELSAAPSED